MSFLHLPSLSSGTPGLGLTVGFLLLWSVACADRGSAVAPGERDDFGNVVAAGTTALPARIVSLNPTTTEILFAIGAGDRVVGRTRWDTSPVEARRVPDVGPGLRPNIEAVLARQPDLVVLYASEDNRDAAAQLAAAGVRTIAMKIDSIGSFVRGAQLLGLATGREEAARGMVDAVLQTLERVRSATDTVDRPTVFWHIWDSPIITIGRGSYMSELVEIAGGRNVYADIEAPSPTIALEDVVRRDPHFVLGGPDGVRALRASPAWQAVPAVRAGRFITIDTALVSRPSIHLGRAALSLARALHPELGL